MTETESRHGWLVTLSLYAAWFITAIGTIIDALAIREAVLAILAWVRVIQNEAYRQAGGVGEDIFTNFGLAAVDYFVVFILAVAAVSFTIWIEYYYRKGRPQGLLYKRIGKVVVVEVVIVVVAMLVREVVARLI